jgi:hypothetical protein
MTNKSKNQLIDFVTKTELETLKTLEPKFNLTELELFEILDALALKIRLHIHELK